MEIYYVYISYILHVHSNSSTYCTISYHSANNVWNFQKRTIWDYYYRICHTFVKYLKGYTDILHVERLFLKIWEVCVAECNSISTMILTLIIQAWWKRSCLKAERNRMGRETHCSDCQAWRWKGSRLGSNRQGRCSQTLPDQVNYDKRGVPQPNPLSQAFVWGRWEWFC